MLSDCHFIFVAIVSWSVYPDFPLIFRSKKTRIDVLMFCRWNGDRLLICSADGEDLKRYCFRLLMNSRFAYLVLQFIC